MAFRLGNRRNLPPQDVAETMQTDGPCAPLRTRLSQRLQQGLGRTARAGAISLALFLVAAAGMDQRAIGSDYNAYQASRLFAAGYNDISKIYIEDVALPPLVLDGLRALRSLDDGFAVARRDGELVVQVDGHRVGSYHVPAPRDTDAWGAVTAGVIDLALRSSSDLSGHSAEDLYARVFDGVLDRLDGYSRYAGADAAQQNRASRDGFGGIGARVQASKQGIEVLSVRSGSPAASMGLTAGDIIVAIDGSPTTALSQRQAIDRLRGQVDSRLTLTVNPKTGSSTRTLRLRRAHIVPQTVKAHAEGRLAVIEISGFNQDTTHSLEQAINALNAEMGEHLAGYVLDLRGNPGGLLDQAVDVADLFVRHGRLVSTHGRHPDSHQYFTARPDDVGDDRPLVVLVDSGSASAAEIVAAAIQDNRRGVIVGSLTYGKGTVQTVLRLPNRGELTLTWARFHAPSGYALSGRGVTPDVCTSRSPDPTLDAVLAELSDLTQRRSRADAQLSGRGDLPNDTAATVDCPSRPAGSPTDMAVARRLLTDRTLYRSASADAPAIAQAAR
ncbi:S41 family peptidase [Rhodovibrio salinarum]|uniref:PDZ domain-containing protein n=1 Tax=Rhodovibrio salinarum TaxID=1087 RepID=A0A934QF16_9PROT|nr:S41 family peptidase [Rhodovibrio salinarum]MBK1695673.1 hypothetical protein [Rhodovibrio salinarum]